MMEPENELTRLAEEAWTDGRMARLEQPYAEAEHRFVSSPMGCGQPLGKPLSTAFRDQASRDEYRIMGMCQSCQDAMFDACLSAEDIADMEARPDRFEHCPDCRGLYPVCRYVHHEKTRDRGEVCRGMDTSSCSVSSHCVRPTSQRFG